MTINRKSTVKRDAEESQRQETKPDVKELAGGDEVTVHNGSHSATGKIASMSPDRTMCTVDMGEGKIEYSVQVTDKPVKNGSYVIGS